MNFAARIADTAAQYPREVAIEHVDGNTVVSTSYAELTAHAAAWTAALAGAGVARGDRVAVLGSNTEPWIAAYLGALRMGAVAVPLDTAYNAQQLHTILSHCSATALCVSDRFAATAETARETLRARGERLPALLLLERTENDAPTPVVDAPIVNVATDDAAIILYTSGTTADPKGVVLTHGNLDAERSAALSVVDCRQSDAILGVLPLFHALAQMANLLVPLAVGARVVFLETINSAALVSALQERGITIFVCVPQFFYLIHQRVLAEVERAGLARRTIFRVLLKTSGWCRDRLRWNPGRAWFGRVHRVLGPRMRLLVTGGSRFDPAIGRDLYDMGFTVLNGYGLTETSGAATVQRPNDRYTTSVGGPLSGVEVRIGPVDRGDRDADDGEILIRGPILMREYFQRPDATAEALRDGWLHTGDLGYLDAQGRVYITGRQKEVIVLSSGKNIYPEEIEMHYGQSPFIKELCVLGLAHPDAPAAERLHAVIVPDEEALKSRGTVNVRELIRFELEGLATRLPAHKRILSFDISRSPLPRTSTGKIRRHEVSRAAQTDAATARERSTSPPETPFTDEQRAWSSDSRHADVLAAIGEQLRKPPHPEANLELDLGLDSMERVELLTALEQRTGRTITAEARAEIFTVRQLVEAIVTAEHRNGDSPAAPAELPWDHLLSQPVDEALLKDLDRIRGLRAIGFYIFSRCWRGVARLMFGFRPAGLDRLPASGPVILAPNHQSYLDGLFLTGALPFFVLRRTFVVGASEYFETRSARWLAKLANIVPVDPDANLVTAMQACASGLRSNHVLLLFPEGERSIDGEVRPFRKGAAILSAYLNVPIVPIAVDGPFALWPRSRPFQWKRLLPWQAPRVACQFAAPFLASRQAIANDTAHLEQIVRGMVKDARARN
jgi:long-chain acyl-CoA synthetase